jgi:pimeloyl-ACP methyl ester carboxylesterase
MPASIRYLLISLQLSSFIFLLALLSPTIVHADYTQFRYDSQSTNAAPYKIDGDLSLKWTSQNLGNLSLPPAIDSDNNIYAPTNAGLVAFDKDGNKKWTFFNGIIRATPIIDPQGNIYFPASFPSGCGSFLYSINKLGQQLWKYDFNPSGTCSANSSSQPTFSPDKSVIYTSTTSPSLSLWAFNLDGTIKWQRGLNGQRPSSPSVAPDGTLYVGTAPSGFLSALTPEGTLKWQRFTASGPTVGVNIPSIDSNGNLYLFAGGSIPATYLSFDPQGNTRWTNTLPNNTSFQGIQALKDNRLYLVYKQTLRSIDTSNGTTLWEWTAPLTTNNNLTSPVIDQDGNIYTALLNSLFIINPTGQTQKTITLNSSLLQPIISAPNQILIPQTFNLTGFLHKLTSTPTKTPLIFIPGIGGSELKIKTATNWSQHDGHGGTYNHIYTESENPIWLNAVQAGLPGNDDFFDILRLKSDGKTNEADIDLTGNLVDFAYKPTIDFFTSNAYKLNQDLFIFPYDWRKDIADTKELLDQKIATIKQQTGTQKVDILAHSMGGLVARNYISDPTKATNIRKLITLGTPHLGSVKFLKALHYGDCLTAFEQIKNLYCLGIPSSEVKDILQNMPGAYALAPSKKYYTFYNGSDANHPLPFKDVRDLDNNGITGDLNYDQTKTLLTNLGHNTLLFNPAEDFHTIDNSLSNANGVDITIIVGSGINTLGQIIEKYKFNFAGLKISEKDEIKINGDDTVPLLSASLDNSSPNSLNGFAKVYYSKQTHNGLAENGPALNLARNILFGDPILPSGISEQSFDLNGKQLSVHSPVNIHAYDAVGNHTGSLSNGDFETNIPGSTYDELDSTYDELDDAKFIFLPNDGVYQIKFEATNQGSFDFKISDYKNSTSNKTILYKDIPLAINTKAETTFDSTSSTPPILQLYKDGDSTIDEQVSYTSTIIGGSITDNQPPKTQVKLSGIQGNNNWFKNNVTVELYASDESSGSGILRTEYSLDNGQTINNYLQPFIISTEGTVKLKVRSIDQAGNEEEPYESEIKLDKTAPNISLSTNPNILWPPNNSFIDVQIHGFSEDDNLESIRFFIEDEYHLVEPILFNFEQYIKLQASRDNNDKDGRIYTIRAIAIDKAGNQTNRETKVLVPHDQGDNN